MRKHRGSSVNFLSSGMRKCQSIKAQPRDRVSREILKGSLLERDYINTLIASFYQFTHNVGTQKNRERTIEVQRGFFSRIFGLRSQTEKSSQPISISLDDLHV